MPTQSEIRPNLFIIGAAKSGTTSLHHYLQAHPDVFMSDPKEPGYFTPGVAYYPTDEDWYLGLFQSAGDARIVGESSTHYAKLPTYPGAAERIAEFCEAPRFIYLMRDPIERAVSHYWHRVRQFDEHRSLDDALEKDEVYAAYSDYGMQLEPYFRTFGRDRVLVLVFEEMVKDPERTVRHVYDWLGLEGEFSPEAFEKKNRRPPEVERLRGTGLLDRFARTAVWNRLSPSVPRALKNLGNRMARERVNPKDESPASVIAAYRPIFRPRVLELERDLGLDLSAWQTTLGTQADPASRAARG